MNLLDGNHDSLIFYVIPLVVAGTLQQSPDRT